jgi:iron complex outermembrane recepter protein
MTNIRQFKSFACASVALSAFAVAAPAWAQGGGLPPQTGQATPLPQSVETTPDGADTIFVTGSRIRRDPNDSALPLQIVTNRDLLREGISSPEQFISYLSTNGNGADNLASNSDVTSGAQRGTNGLSAANLRGQGAASTLVLLNGRRVAAHGLTGGAVDINQIPFAAIERIEVLKDGASAIYGTDAIGGVINYITRTDYQGVGMQGFTDITEAGGAEIYRVSGIAGWGDLDENGFNIMGSVAYRWSNALRGDQRDFVNTNQPNRGLSVDTRGTPIATAFPANPNAIFAPQGSLLGGTSGATALPGLVFPGTTTLATGGINVLDLPGGAGCASVDGGLPYDEQLWAVASARFACAWDTGRAATLQQPINTLTYYGRATARIGEHEIYAEITGSQAESSKIFSNNQYSINATTLPLYYPLNATTATTYNDIYSRLVAQFPAIAANYGRPIAYRWRCVACGPREYETTTTTFRAALGVDGPLWAGWDYRAGASYAKSQASSVLGSGYHFRGIFPNAASAAASGVAGAVSGGIDTRAPTAPGATQPGIVGLLNSGILNPFSVNQSPAAIAALQSISAEGTALYGGQYETTQFDASISGGLFDLPGGTIQLALGVDYRRERYSFNGSAAAVTGTPDIFNVAFDNVNALTPKTRNVFAAYGEVLFPILRDVLDVTVAARLDNYTGFGTTVNPKVSALFSPLDWLRFRGSFNTGFRVPAFNQIFNGTTQSPNPGNALVDPTTCATGVVNPAIPGCAAITPDTLTGGNLGLGPETSKQFSLGAVFLPAPRISFSVDYWNIAVDDTIGTLTTQQLLANAAFFPERLVRTNGIVTLLDLRTANLGSRRTEGLEFQARGAFDLGGGTLTLAMDGTYLLRKRERLLPAAPYSASLIGVFTYAGDLGLRWKHNASVTWNNEQWTLSLSQIFRNGYTNQALPGIANGSVVRPDYNPRVEDYIVYNAAVGFRVSENYTLTLGVRNLFDNDPPFAITYDSNTGAGSSWEPRVADPRGRSFTVDVNVRF